MIIITSIGLTVSDMERSLDFYTTILFFQKISDREVTGTEFERMYGLGSGRSRAVKLQLGQEIIHLTEFLTPKGRPIPSDSQSNDRWFQHLAIAVRDLEQAYQHLQHYQVSQVSPNPQTLPASNPTAGGIQAFYFKDPDGHNLELIHFPQGKGDPKWHSSDVSFIESPESLFLGIEHTAIVVADTKASLGFYCDRLGMKLEQQSQNSGIEQEQLSDISGVQVQVSSLKASSGLGIELLEYLEPNQGRSIPIDTRANDLWFGYIEAVSAIANQPQEANSPLISIDVSSDLGFNQKLEIQDPDGHRLRLINQ
jgi:catechol 2,3-dioxygenase-like lactoylglutathione lyase family enzyme